MAALGNRELPVPEHIDIFHLKREQPASDKTALESVMEVDEIRLKLEHEADELASRGDDESEWNQRILEWFMMSLENNSRCLKTF